MKTTVPEIAWHNKSPVFSVDIQLNSEKGFYRAATGGGDSHIVIWHLVLDDVTNEVTANFAADLDRHIKAVNVVRFSKNGEFLASGDDDAIIILWTLKEGQPNASSSFNSEEINKENWTSVKILRGHKDDIYDLCWLPSSNEFLLSGSVDNTAIIWNVEKGISTGTLGEHNGFVQGVAWDPKGMCLATLSSDRALRVFDSKSRKLMSKVTKAKLNKTTGDEDEDGEENFIRLFHDDTVKTFFRRLTFSPDGLLLFVPCGIYKESENEVKPPKDVTYVFIKDKPDRPVLHLPSPDEYTVAVKCCPLLFNLRPTDSNVFNLPYRIIFAVASRRSIVFYDTQQTQPFAFVTDIHYATLTDISWSADGRLLLASSSDGYCTIVSFSKEELGVPYVGTMSNETTTEATGLQGAESKSGEDMECDILKGEGEEQPSGIVRSTEKNSSQSKREEGSPSVPITSEIIPSRLTVRSKKMSSESTTEKTTLKPKTQELRVEQPDGKGKVEDTVTMTEIMPKNDKMEMDETTTS